MAALDFPSTPSAGDVFSNYIYDAVKGVWRLQSNIPGVSSRYQVSDTAPSSPNSGDIWFNSNDAVPYMWYVDVDGGQWIEVGGLNGASDPYIVSDTPPAEVVNGTLWFDTTTGNTFVYYTDSDSSQWVQISGISTGASLDALGDVDVTGVVIGQALVYNGTKWVNGQSAGGFEQQFLLMGA